MSAGHLACAGSAHAPTLLCSTASKARPTAPLRSLHSPLTAIQALHSSTRQPLICCTSSTSRPLRRCAACYKFKPHSRAATLLIRPGRTSTLHNLATSYRRHGACQIVAASSSAAPIDPNFPEPAAARSQLDKVADVLTTLFPVWVGVLLCLHADHANSMITWKLLLCTVTICATSSAGVPRSFNWNCKT